MPVEPQWKELLIALYKQIQRDLTIMEPGTPYRELVEETTKFRLAIVQKHDDHEQVEEEIGAGQVEELVSKIFVTNFQCIIRIILVIGIHIFL